MKNLRQAHWPSVVLYFCCILASESALAFSFTMSEAEFLVWPEYCQARYLTSDPGMAASYTSKVPRSIIDKAKVQLGPNSWDRVHHWCAGMTWLSRSRVQLDPKLREFQLTTAAHEAQFTFQGLEPDSPLIPLIYITFGQVCQEQKDFKCAIENFEKSIAAKANNPSPYSALALLYSRNKQFELAREVLMRGDQALEGKSAEIHYNLGLILLDMNDVDGALSHAQKAYLGGYSLPGLKKKLTQIGRWIEPTPVGVKPPQAAQTAAP